MPIPEAPNPEVMEADSKDSAQSTTTTSSSSQEPQAEYKVGAPHPFFTQRTQTKHKHITQHGAPTSDQTRPALLGFLSLHSKSVSFVKSAICLGNPLFWAGKGFCELEKKGQGSLGTGAGGVVKRCQNHSAHTPPNTLYIRFSFHCICLPMPVMKTAVGSDENREHHHDLVSSACSGSGEYGFVSIFVDLFV